MFLSTSVPTDEESMQDAIKRLMRRDPSISLDKMAKALGKDRSKVMRVVNGMKDEGAVERVGGTRGRWLVNDGRTGM